MELTASFYFGAYLVIFLPSIAISWTFSLEEVFNPDPKNFQLVSHQYSSYRNDSTKNWNTLKGRDIHLTNLAETIDKIPNCLHHIVNYNGIDLLPPKTPIVLARYDVIHVKYQILTATAKTPQFTEWTRTIPFENVVFSPENSSALE